MTKSAYDADCAYRPIEDWLWDNIGYKEYDGDNKGIWDRDLDDSQNPFILDYYFQNEKDAMLFALRWANSQYGI